MAHYTRCGKCRKWDDCARCGACHTCRPDVRDACVALRTVQEAQALQRGQATRKRQSSPFAPGMGQNGTKPRASHPMTNWYKPVLEAERHPEEVQVVRPGKAHKPGEHYVPVLEGDARRRAMYATW